MRVQVAMTETVLTQKVYEVRTEDETEAMALAERHAEKEQKKGLLSSEDRGRVIERTFEATAEGYWQRTFGYGQDLSSDYEVEPVIYADGRSE